MYLNIDIIQSLTVFSGQDLVEIELTYDGQQKTNRVFRYLLLTYASDFGSVFWYRGVTSRMQPPRDED
jgi:hypothetical protein